MVALIEFKVIRMKMPVLLALVTTLCFPASSPQLRAQAVGPLFKAAPNLDAGAQHESRKQIDAFRRWNQAAVDASGLDHTPGFHQELGPGRSARAMAIVHVAMFDAMNAISGDYESYTGVRAPNGPISRDAAISQAAHDTLVALFPAQQATFDARLARELNRLRDKKGKASGIELGRRSAAAILALKANDGSAIPEPIMGTEFITSNEPGHWRQDPISLVPIALGAHWGDCVPFVLASVSQFRSQPPPPLSSIAYAIAYEEAKRLGGDGVITPTERTPEQTHIGFYWAYDGTPSLCAPPRLYNQIAVHIADQMGSDELQTARLLTIINVAMADAAVACWDSKYFYDFWRPVTGIRESDPGTGPTLAGDGNEGTVGDLTFTPLGAPASNLSGPNFTPPFPAYPSGHATFGATMFQILRRFYGTDDIPFTFVSDEFNGVTRGSDDTVRPLLPRSFSSLSQAEEENGQSRIYLGIHWSFDKTAGIVLGHEIGDYVFDRTFRPLHRQAPK